MSELDNLIAGTRIFFAVHEYAKQPELERAATELAKLKEAWKVSKELMQALYDARSDLPRTATLAFNWLKDYGDLYPEEKKDE